MPTLPGWDALTGIPDLTVTENVPLARYTRFGIGGPASLLADAATEPALIAALQLLQQERTPFTVIGGGTNLVVSDRGFPGVVLRYVASSVRIEGTRLTADAGAVLQTLVDRSIAQGLSGIHTMTGIPGWFGGAVYGNAGAYGRSIHESLESVRYFDGSAVCEIGNAECEFSYRESIFKRKKDRVILSAVLRLTESDSAALADAAAKILQIRNAKYPPTMRCAGSIFKNLLYAQLPESIRVTLPSSVVREGKVPSAYFLEQAGAKGLASGDVKVATYHANLIYNDGAGTAADVRILVEDLKARVHEKFGIELEEEVQYVGPA